MVENEASGAAAMKVSSETDSEPAMVAGEFLNAKLQHCGLADVGKQSKLVSLLEGSYLEVSLWLLCFLYVTLIGVSPLG